MGNLKTYTGVQFFEDYLVPTNGQTKNKLFELTGLPWGARRSPWLSLQRGTEMYGLINACRMRIVSALAKGGAHALAAVQCGTLGYEALNGNSADALPYAIAGIIANAYLVAIQADTGARCIKVLEQRREPLEKRRERKAQERSSLATSDQP